MLHTGNRCYVYRFETQAIAAPRSALLLGFAEPVDGTLHKRPMFAYNYGG